MSISSDEINFLIYRYLQENGFTHSAFSFSHESLVNKSSVAETDVPPGALITFLQKGLEYIGIEENIDEDGTIREFDSNYSLLSPFVCDAVANREDRRVKRRVQSNNESTSSETSTSSSSSSNSNTLNNNSNNNNNNINNNASVKNESSQSDSMEIVTTDASFSSSSLNGESKRDVIDSTIASLDNTKNTNSASSVNHHHSSSPSSSVAISKKENNMRHLSLTGHQGEVFMCVWNPIQSKLASGSADGVCRVWDLNDMKNEEAWNQSELTGQVKIRTAIMPHADAGERLKDITSISWSPDGQHLATGCYTGESRIWDNKGNLKMILNGHSGPVFSLKWNKQGTYLLSGSYDRRTIIWSPVTGKIIKQFLLHSQSVLDVDWRDEDAFASCSSDMTIQVCSVSSSTSKSICVLKGHVDEVNAVCWSPGGEFLASCSDDSTAKIWCISSSNADGTSSDSSSSSSSSNNSSINGQVAKTTTTTTIVDGKLLHSLKGHDKEIFTLRWTLTGPHSSYPASPLLLCTASFDGTVKVWEALHGQLIYTLGEHTQPVYSVSPSPYGFLLAMGSLGGHVSVWSLLDGSLLHEVNGPGDTFDVSWSVDGSLLSACFSSGSIMVQDANSLYQCQSRDIGKMSPQDLLLLKQQPPPPLLPSSSSSLQAASIIDQVKTKELLVHEKRKGGGVEVDGLVKKALYTNDSVDYINNDSHSNTLNQSHDILNSDHSHHTNDDSALCNSKMKTENGTVSSSSTAAAALAAGHMKMNGHNLHRTSGISGDMRGSSSSSGAPSSSSSLQKSSVQIDITDCESNSSSNSHNVNRNNPITSCSGSSSSGHNNTSGSNGDDSDSAAMDEVCMVTSDDLIQSIMGETTDIITTVTASQLGTETDNHKHNNHHHHHHNGEDIDDDRKIRLNDNDDEDNNNNDSHINTNGVHSENTFLHQ